MKKLLLTLGAVASVAAPVAAVVACSNDNGGSTEGASVTSFSIEDLLKSKGYTLKGSLDGVKLFDVIRGYASDAADKTVNFHFGKITSGKATSANKNAADANKGGVDFHNADDFLIVVNGGTQTVTTEVASTGDNKLAELDSTDAKFVEQWGDLGTDAFKDATSIIYLHHSGTTTKVSVNQVFKKDGKIFEATQSSKPAVTEYADGASVTYAAPTAA